MFGAFVLCSRYLGCQKSGQVDFRNHLTASVSFSLVTVLMIFHQVPQFSSWRDNTKAGLLLPDIQKPQLLLSLVHHWSM